MRQLLKHYELTNNTPVIMECYAAMSCDAGLLALLLDRAQCRNFALSTLIVDMVRWAVVNVCNEQLLTLLRPLFRVFIPSPYHKAEVGEEVHITVGVVR